MSTHCAPGAAENPSRTAPSAARRALERWAQLLLPLMAAAWCYGGAVSIGRPLPDEQAYVCAARALARGDNPYICDRYIYPPLLAQLEAAAAQVLPEKTVQSAVRALNVAASVWLALFAVGLWTEDRWRRALAACVLLWWSPNLADALDNGNLGPLICALLVWSLARWHVQPMASGLVLGVSLALKPLGPVAWLLLAFHRPQSGRRAPQLIAAGLAALVVAVLSWPGRALLPQLVARTSGYPEAMHNVSLQRVAHSLGFTFAPYWQVFAACAVTLMYVRRAPRAPTALMHLSCASVLLSQPIVWSHTLVLIYPTLAAAIARASREPAGTQQEQWLRILYVCLGCMCVVECNMFGDLAFVIANPFAAVVAAIPLGLSLALAGYASGARTRCASLEVCSRQGC